MKKTIANLSKCPPQVVETLRLALRGVQLVSREGFFAIETSTPHDHVQAVLGTIPRLGLDTLLSTRPCRERDLVMAGLAP